jgi:hypothetical protein
MGLEGVTIASVQVVDVLERAVDGQHSLFIKRVRVGFISFPNNSNTKYSF